MLYTRKINPISSDTQNGIFDFEVAALNMMNFEWSYIFPRSRINLSSVVSFIYSWRYRRSKIDSGGHFEENHISDSLRGISILGYGVELPWSQLNLKSVKRL